MADTLAHTHHPDDCDHNHGQVARFVHALEHKAAHSNLRLRRFMVAFLRALSLVFCPGDDIAAIGLQLYSSIDGHSDAHHHETKAILPEPVRLEVNRRSKKMRT